MPPPRDESDSDGLRVDPEGMLDRITDGFLAVDDDWRFTYLNDRAESLLGREGEDLRGRVAWDVLPDGEDSAVADNLRAAREMNRTVTFEHDALGETYEVRAYPSDSGLSVLFRTASGRREFEAELARNAETLHELYEVTSATDLEFEEKRRRILELGRAHLGLPYGFVTRIADGTQRIVAAEGDHPLLQSGESCPVEQSYCRKTIETDGLLAVFDAVEEGWADDLAYEVFDLGCYIGGKLVVDGEVYGTLCFAAIDPRRSEFTDGDRTIVELMSKSLAYELETRRYTERLERENERLEQFAEIVSHDVRNVLTSLGAKLEIARRRNDELDVEEAEAALARAFDVVDDVLAFARMGTEVVDTTPLDVAVIARDAWTTADTREATLQVEAGTGTIDADREKLRRLFENLFVNAVEHGGESVTVRVGPLDGRDGFYVADDGRGIPPEVREDVFEYGVSGDPAGTGLGLAIVEDIVTAHGWTVTAAEDETGGARFEVAVA